MCGPDAPRGDHKVVVFHHPLAGFGAARGSACARAEGTRTYISFSSSAMTSMRFLRSVPPSVRRTQSTMTGHSQFDALLEAVPRKVVRVPVKGLAVQYLVAVSSR